MKIRILAALLAMTFTALAVNFPPNIFTTNQIANGVAGQIPFSRGLSGIGWTNAAAIASNAPPAGTVYPIQFGAAGNGVLDLVSLGIGRIQAALINGTDDSASLNTMFNTITNGTTVDGQNKIYFVNSQVNCTNANLIKVQNFWFVTTNRNMVTFNVCTVGSHFQNLIFVGTTNTVTSCAVSNDFFGNFTDYGVDNVWTDIIVKGGHKFGFVARHQSNLKIRDSVIGNCSSNCYNIQSCDQVMLDSCVSGYAFDAQAGGLNGELGGGGNISWTNCRTFEVNGGIGVTFLNCDNNTSGTLLHAANTTIRFIGGDFEQFYNPINSPICWLTNCTVTCDGSVNFLNNNASASNNMTTWKLDGCNMNSCTLSGGLATTTVPGIDIVTANQPANSHLLPMITWQVNGALARVHAAYADAGSAGVDYDVSRGNVVSSTEANTFIQTQIFTNLVWIKDGKSGLFGLGSDISGGGTVTVNNQKTFDIAMPSFAGTTPDTYMIGGFSQAAGNTHLILGGANIGGTSANDIWFEVGGASALTGIWDTTGFYPWLITVSLGTSTHQWSQSFIGGTEQVGALTILGTNNTGSLSASISTNYSGKVKIASGSQTYVITDAQVVNTMAAYATVNTTNATATSCQAFPGSGVLTLKLNAAASADCDVSWWINKMQ